ncbi:rhomboid-domain-containing protein [Stereum hirsutum FP-91666 SS1]|uniref:rhomboid-domain-containing protein n=1 Tax=Stereum hirsutum (strain FP-91666) TaxID=721885 RepID=UPI000440CF9A|nr:rhomboid-domain-containing protein [Stereum hirsutum FP-91666 SS1]EIM92599.1 rhomboid-domain-containing protein [Stereum hirsutum FP-91666 SS1]
MNTTLHDQHDSNQHDDDVLSPRNPPGIITDTASSYTASSYPATNASDPERGVLSPTTLAADSPVSLSRRVSTQSQGLNVDRASGAPSIYPYSQGPRLSYIDENFDHYSTPPAKPEYFNDKGDDTLVDNAAGYGGVHSGKYEDFEFADGQRSQPVSEKPSPWGRFLSNGKYPIEQRIEDKKRGIGRQKYPIVVWALSIAMVGVFINELVVNSRAQGTPVSFKPTVNPMLGPSTSALINLGARFPPCMKNVTDVPVSTLFPCLNDTANPPDITCAISEICDLSDANNPNQAWRFVSPVFVHAGFIHIILNLLAQLTAVAQIEREMGSGGFIILYFAAGIFGNVLGGNFALVGVPSMGASGAIFGSIAVSWIDLFAHWQFQYRPVRKLVFMIIELVFVIAMGFIPSHLGGFLMGLLVGATFYPVISTTRKHKMIMWGLRLAAIPLAIVLYVVLTRNFYTSDPYAACSWCRYISCIPTSSNNHCKG